jgi:hypothetical protein
MLDPRIYRTGLVAVAVAVIVLAFSLTGQQGPVGTTLPPEAFNGQNAYRDMVGLAQKFPSRLPGSTGDRELAAAVARAFRKDGFSVSAQTTAARTAIGTRQIETVTGVLAGQTSGSIVVLAHRDALSSPATADLSGTAALLELARVLGGETQHRSIALVSTSSSAGLAGASDVARTLSKPVDAVIALGDLANARPRSPVIVPWSNGQPVAPTLLRNTLAAALGTQAGLAPGDIGLGDQLAHLAFPLSATEQGPFGAQGYPAVLLSLSGTRAPAADEAIDPGRIADLGRTVLQTVNALDSGPSVPAPSAYLLYSGKLVPAWAIRILVLALILPVLMATIDGVARARRRGHRVLRWIVWVLAGGLPFVIAALVVVAARLTGVLGVTPPGPVGAGQVPLSGAGIAVLATVALLGVLTYLLRRSALRASSNRQELGKGAALLIVMCVIALVIWVHNPFAAALLVPALHLWMWVADPEVALPRPAALVLLLIGAAPGALVALYYALSLGLGPIGFAWNGLLLVAGGYVGIAAAVQWSVVLGCLASAITITIRRPRPERPKPEQIPVTVRGPITYAGPGSLGGTESALRR